MTLLDGDVVRRLLSAGLGFSADDRDLNVRRIGYVAAEVARHGGLAVAAPIAPYARSRAAVREMVEDAGATYVLVHVSTPLEVCEARDRKGLYAKARRGEIESFTGDLRPVRAPDRRRPDDRHGRRPASPTPSRPSSPPSAPAPCSSLMTADDAGAARRVASGVAGLAGGEPRDDRRRLGRDRGSGRRVVRDRRTRSSSRRPSASAGSTASYGRFDEERHGQRMTPRRKRSKWSDSNRARVERLEADGVMTDAGRQAIDAPKQVAPGNP